MSLADRPELAETVRPATKEQVQEIGIAFLGICQRDEFLIDPPLDPPTLTHAVQYGVEQGDQGDVTVRLSSSGSITVLDHSVVSYDDRLHKRVSTVMVADTRIFVRETKFIKGNVDTTYYQDQGNRHPVVAPQYGNPEDELKSLSTRERDRLRFRMRSIEAGFGDNFSVAHYKHMLWLIDQFNPVNVARSGQSAVAAKPKEE